MADALERVLQLVAEGRLTAEEAAPLLDALEAAAPPPTAPPAPGESAPTGDGGPGSAVRIEVSDGGRKVINLRVPLALGKTAIEVINELSDGDPIIAVAQSGSWKMRSAPTWRTPSPPPGGARPRCTASTSWWCTPG